MNDYLIGITIGRYAGGGTSGAFLSESSGQFDTVVKARTESDAMRVAQAQYGGQERCRVTFRRKM